MNAIRIRKENQVYSAEEQRALAMFNYEEKANREAQLINDLREMLSKPRRLTIHTGPHTHLQLYIHADDVHPDT